MKHSVTLYTDYAAEPCTSFPCRSSLYSPRARRRSTHDCMGDVYAKGSFGLLTYRVFRRIIVCNLFMHSIFPTDIEVASIHVLFPIPHREIFQLYFVLLRGCTHLPQSRYQHLTQTAQDLQIHITPSLSPLDESKQNTPHSHSEESQLDPVSHSKKLGRKPVAQYTSHSGWNRRRSRCLKSFKMRLFLWKLHGVRRSK